ncbi:hypothetical protein [Sorangium sp. So ce233]|uniref:hypothetical protein n=1 Tax=Sorangium sp. So ce233 TaxID=3133290 RepID=UPI003F63867F
MSLPINREAHRQLIDDDIAWLETVPRTLERDHVLSILRAERRTCALHAAIEAEDAADPGRVSP